MDRVISEVLRNLMFLGRYCTGARTQTESAASGAWAAVHCKHTVKAGIPLLLVVHAWFDTCSCVLMPILK